MISKNRLTVIICTYNRKDLLKECLNSLTRQKRKDFDTLVINNNCTDSTSEVVSQFADLLNIQEIFEENQGLSYARNTGYREAQTEWVAYLDDDAKAKEDWIERIYTTIKTQSFEGFGGVYLPWYLYGKPKWYKDRYASNSHFFKKKGIHALSGIQFISGGNAIFRRDILLESSGFPLELGMSGNELKYGEEIILQRELINKGYSLGVNTELIIYHLVPKYKLNVSFFLESYKRKGSVYFSHRNNAPFRVISFIIQGLLSVSFVLLKSTLLFLARNDYYLENWKIDTLTKFYFYIHAIKGYQEK
ncbi:glycosyltransferase family 2 protein [Ekhidna sp.]|uniref:glycosyltransferase family 2 protein n=1 Tax=Ekhidna sp. TaxID=2608089 RepID=UPI003CCB9476